MWAHGTSVILTCIIGIRSPNVNDLVVLPGRGVAALSQIRSSAMTGILRVVFCSYVPNVDSVRV